MDSDLNWPKIKNEKNEYVKLNYSAYRNLRYAYDVDVRKTSIKEFITHLSKYENVFGLLLTNRIEADLIIAKHRKFQSGIDAILNLRDGLPVKSFKTMLKVANDLGLDSAGFMAVYKKRWSVEEYHKGTEQNASAGRSPANSLKALANHIFHSILAYVKLEKLRLAHGTNHFAMKAKVYLAAVKAAYNELNRIKGIKVDYETA
ncbi:MAG TPA: hypothetical protein VFD29_08130 [Gillisia sp.]|nr:hypothetical protein [Gillisia sp.]